MTAYYNEHDPYAAQWLRNLIAAGHIAPGIVDERSIEDVQPRDLHGFAQCHFFAGIGVWSHALRNSGWGDDRPVWTGSCPCQPFSAAGKGAGFDDERHLWPAFHHLIKECKPPVVFGEQVASKDAEPWIDLVQTDLEALGYAFGAIPFPAASVGAPHIRDRLYWVANNNNKGLEGRRRVLECAAELSTGEGGLVVGLADAANERLHGWRAGSACNGQDAARVESERLFNAGGMADSDSNRRDSAPIDRGNDTKHNAQPCSEFGGVAHTIMQQRPNGKPRVCHEHDALGRVEGAATVAGLRGDSGRPGPTNGYWRDSDWLLCRDGKWRPVEPGTFPLVNGAPARVGRLRAYGNAINAQAAQVFIESVMEIAE